MDKQLNISHLTVEVMALTKLLQEVEGLNLREASSHTRERESVCVSTYIIYKNVLLTCQKH
jgi:hypothetical protein